MKRALSTLAMAAGMLLAGTGTALAGSTAVTVGTPFASGPPAVAVAPNGDAIVAWANTKDLGGANNFVQYCVLPLGATTCARSGNLIPSASAQAVDGVQVLADGGTLVILADVFGTSGSSPSHYEPVQEWQSTDGGATWTAMAGGQSVTNGILNADTGPLNAVIVPGTNVLGFGWDTAAGAPTFNAFPLGNPPECSRATCQTGFATLEPDTNPDQISNVAGQFASRAGSAPGVLGIYETLFTDSGPLSCPDPGFGTAFVYGAGNQSAGNDYNVSPGSPGSAWTGPVAKGSCGVENPAVAGGPSGFGVFESDENNGSTVYQRFDPATRSFGPMVPVAGQHELYAAGSQDGAGGIYATYLLGGPGGPLGLAYSANGGQSFTAGVVNANPQGSIDHVTSSVNGSGQGWAAWEDHGTIVAQPFQAADAISPVVAGGNANSNGATVTLTIICASLPCTVTVTITSSAATVQHALLARRARPVVLARGTVTIRHGHSVKLKLTPAGRRYLAHRTRLKAGLTVVEHSQRHSRTTTRVLNLRVRRPRH